MHVRVHLGSESYALPVAMVREVGRLGDVAQLPGAPASVLGLYNLHGSVIPVIDLARLLGLPRGAPAQKIVVAEHAGRLAGLAVEAITGVQEIGEASEEAQSPHLSGAALVDGALVGVIDLPSMFDSLQPAHPQ
jgi:purine-binding chemotaxis protein CheW